MKMCKKLLSMLLITVILIFIIPLMSLAVEDNHTHTYAEGTCIDCGVTVSPYIQPLPGNIMGCTNLYDILTPQKGYYTATKYDTTNGDVLSVVIPVEPGDRIAANSFGSTLENMGPVNGIRVTYLLGDKIIISLSAGDVYAGYNQNGYLTVPDGVNAVCVPWWEPHDSNYLTLAKVSNNFAIHSPVSVPVLAPTCTENGYTAGEICVICNASLGERSVIPPTGHSYHGDTCTVCGSVNVLAILDGKYVSILGDSISTFNGYSNDDTVNTTIGKNAPRYDVGSADTKPGSYCLLESVDDTWWMHFANRSGLKLLVNNSWAGSQVFGEQTSDGRQIPPAYIERCINLHDNTTENNPGNANVYPDVIFVYMGINDYNFNRSNVGTNEVNYAGLIDGNGTYVTPSNFGQAYGIMLHKIKKTYPDAQIFAMTLLPENLYSVDKNAWQQHNVYIRAAADYFDIPVVDLAENCTITWDNYSDYMIDKIHPTTAGMEQISNCIEVELTEYYNDIYSSSDNDIATTGWSLSLGDQVGINFYVTVGDNFLNNSEITIFIDGETETYTMNQGILDEETGSYRFTVPIAAAQMTEPVTVKFTVDGKEISSKTYTVRDYALYILDESNGYDDSIRALVSSLLNYGAASQNYFTYQVDNLANAGYEPECVAKIPESIPEVTVDDNLYGFQYYGSSVLFYGELTVRFYFEMNGNSEDYQVSTTAESLSWQSKDGLYYVDVSGICPQNIDEAVFLYITDGARYLTVDYSPMHYIARMYHKENTSEALKQLLLALYDYHLSAEAYWNYLNSVV